MFVRKSDLLYSLAISFSEYVDFSFKYPQVKCRIIVFNRINQISYGYHYIQLFFYFSYKSLLWRLSGLNLSARELPLSFKFSVASCSCKYPVTLTDNCCYHSNYFHIVHLYKFQQLLLHAEFVTHLLFSNGVKLYNNSGAGNLSNLAGSKGFMLHCFTYNIRWDNNR